MVASFFLPLLLCLPIFKAKVLPCGMSDPPRRFLISSLMKAHLVVTQFQRYKIPIQYLVGTGLPRSGEPQMTEDL